MRPVHVRIRHDDDLVVAEPGNIELVPPDTRPQRHYQVADLLAREHPVEPRPLHVQDFAAQGQNSLRPPVPAGLGRASGTVTLHEEKLGLGGVLFRAILQLAGEVVHIHCRLAPREFARLARRLAGERRLDDLANDDLGLVRVLLEPFGQFLVYQPLDRGPHLGAHQLVLGLR